MNEPRTENLSTAPQLKLFQNNRASFAAGDHVHIQPGEFSLRKILQRPRLPGRAACSSVRPPTLWIRQLDGVFLSNPAPLGEAGPAPKEHAFLCLSAVAGA